MKTFEVNGIKYEINSDGISVTVIRNAYSGIVIIPPQVQYLNNIYRVTSIGEKAFWGCSGITSLTLPDSVTSIGDSAFRGCSGITSLTIPDSVTSIGDWAFRDCSGITSLTIPDSVTSIGEYAFKSCNALTEIKSFAQVPPTCDNCAFDNINKEECILYVPKGRIYAYKQAVGWNDFVCIKEM